MNVDINDGKRWEGYDEYIAKQHIKLQIFIIFFVIKIFWGVLICF